MISTSTNSAISRLSMSMAQNREPSPANSNSTSMFSGVSRVYRSALDIGCGARRLHPREGQTRLEAYQTHFRLATGASRYGLGSAL